MNLLVTSVVRRSSRHEPSGHIFTVDLHKGRVTSRCPSPEPDLLIYERNERGGMRGAKGVCVVHDRICLANDSVIRLYDTGWKLIRAISHPSCAGIHDILHGNDCLWVTSARNDLVVQFDWNGTILGYFYFREHENLLRELNVNVPPLISKAEIVSGKLDFRDPRKYLKEEYDRAHVNSLCFLPQGDMLVSLGCITSSSVTFLLKLKRELKRIGVWRPLIELNHWMGKRLGFKKSHQEADLVMIKPTYLFSIVRVRKDGSCSAVLKMPGTTVPNHSLLVMPDGTILFNDTTNGEVVGWDPKRETVLFRIPVDRRFLRGIAMIDDHRIVVGSQNSVFVVDLRERRIMGEVVLSDDPRVAVFAISKLPAGTSPLPHKLPES